MIGPYVRKIVVKLISSKLVKLLAEELVGKYTKGLIFKKFENGVSWLRADNVK